MLARLRFLWAVASFAWAVMLGAIVWLFTHDRRRVSNAVSNHMANTVCRRARMEVHLLDVERACNAEPCVIVANHQSQVDHQILAHLYRCLRDPVAIAKMVGKWNLPVAKPLFLATGNIVVDPSNPVRIRRALQRAAEELRAGRTVMLYPEGTRARQWSIGPFQRGAFVLAIDAQVAIVPVVVSHLAPAWDPHAPRVDPQVVSVRVLEPFSTVGLTRADSAALRDRVREAMQEVLAADDIERGVADPSPLLVPA